MRTLIGFDQSTAVASSTALVHNVYIRLLLIALLIIVASAFGILVCRSMSNHRKRQMVLNEEYRSRRLMQFDQTPPPDYITAIADRPPAYRQIMIA